MIPMSPEASAYFGRIHKELQEFIDKYRNLAPIEETTVRSWLDRLLVTRDMARDLHSLSVQVHEFRRGYGHEVEEATLNQMVQSLENGMSLITSMLTAVHRALSHRMEDADD